MRRRLLPASATAISLAILGSSVASATVTLLARGSDRGYRPRVTLTATNPVQTTYASINALMTSKPDHLWVFVDGTWSCTASDGVVTAGEVHRKGNNLWRHAQLLASVPAGSICTVDVIAKVRVRPNDPHESKTMKVLLNLKTNDP